MFYMSRKDNRKAEKAELAAEVNKRNDSVFYSFHNFIF